MKASMYSKGISCLLGGLILSFLTLIPSLAKATVFYVATTGNDTQAGTELAPFQTIERGVISLTAGDTLYVKSGTYAESILSWKTAIPNGTSWDNPITVAANPGDTVIITPPSGHAFFWVKDGQAKYLIIDGFIVDGKNKALHGFKFSDNARYIRVKNTEIKNAKETAILVSLCSGCPDPASFPVDTYHEFINLQVHDNGSSRFDHGFYITTSYNLIKNSEIYGNTGYGIHFYKVEINTANYNVASYNTVYNNQTTDEWGCGILASSGKGNEISHNIAYGNFAGICTQYRSTDALVYNNIVYKNKVQGIYVGESSDQGSLIYNNTVYNNDQYGIFVGNGSQLAVVKNNISYQNGIDDLYLEPGDQTGTVTDYNLTTDPKCVDAEANNFDLAPDSLAINQGTPISEIQYDFDDDPRNDGFYDIGAHEFQGTSPEDPPLSPTGLTFLPQ